jgi:hypothetical protein
LCVAIDTIQASPNGILPAFTAGDDRPNFLEPRVATDLSNFMMPFFTRHDYDFGYRSRALERADCMSDHRFTRDYGKQFIETHALAAARGYDDG